MHWFRNKQEFEKYRKETEIFRIEDAVNEAYLAEERHVYMECQEAVEELADILYDKFKKNETGFFKTGIYYEPNTKTCNIYEQGYPIYVDCIDDDTVADMRMQIEDYQDNPEEILLVVNFSGIRNTTTIDLKRMRSLVKHEFGHIRQNYTYINGTQRLIDTRKFVSDNFDPTLLSTINRSHYGYIRKFMYLFSPIEQQQRLAELYEYVNNMTEGEIFGIMSGKIHKHCSNEIKQIIVDTSDIHLRNKMQDCVEDLKRWKKIDAMRMIMTIAFYLKYYNIYKTRDEINTKLLDDMFHNKEDKNDVIFYYENFLYWLNDQILEYTKKIYTVVHYNLYKRFLEESDIQYYGVDFGERISEGLIEQLNEQYGDERIPLLNKPIDY